MLPTLPILEPPDIQIPSIIRPVDEKPKPLIYIVQKGDSLTKIARERHTSVLRLFYANKAIEHPDKIKPGTKLVIPSKDEKLKKRKLPDIIKFIAPTSIRPGGFSNSDNTYSVGYCTAWVKDRLPWVRNGWEDAINWGYNAQNDGFNVHSSPIVGSVAWMTSNGGHVAAVESVSGERVYVSEKNWQGWNVLSYRWSDISDWAGFIY